MAARRDGNPCKFLEACLRLVACRIRELGQ